MTDPSLDVVGIGNAIVDVLAQADEAFLKAQDLAKGAMTLRDGARAETLSAAMGPAVEVSGGSAAQWKVLTEHLGLPGPGRRLLRAGARLRRRAA